MTYAELYNVLRGMPGGMSMSDLARAYGRKPKAATSLLTGMEEAGLLCYEEEAYQYGAKGRRPVTVIYAMETSHV
jgi:DNA-binding IclR family transcriptional regulator